ncbi:CMD domain-containing protein [Vreelandella nanhaiensis]|uniref:CMD domain protein n=1 Tax=Vreelandella nanhaiensis TaxID=1258546 RepID=A0A3S0W919_9GAMM|nr:hypothetical protein [Halomonas nanhaiensis]RUR31727.1 hypothetical protein ELY38_09740 [Halomonas nanhaiensis]
MTNIIEKAANVPSTGPLAEALAVRSKLMDLTQASYEAALLPSDEGQVPANVRAALACRMARICQQAGLTQHYAELLAGYGCEADPYQLAEPGNKPPASEKRLYAMVEYVDLVTQSPRDATKADIHALSEAGIKEDDIVRLAGLVAFVNYQLRVAAVLSVMGDAK